MGDMIAFSFVAKVLSFGGTRNLLDTELSADINCFEALED